MSRSTPCPPIHALSDAALGCAFAYIGFQIVLSAWGSALGWVAMPILQWLSNNRGVKAGDPIIRIVQLVPSVLIVAVISLILGFLFGRLTRCRSWYSLSAFAVVLALGLFDWTGELGIPLFVLVHWTLWLFVAAVLSTFFVARRTRNHDAG